MVSSSFTRCPIEATPSSFRVLRQARKNRLVYVILAECRLVPFEAKAPQPDRDVHFGAPNSGLQHIIVRSGQSVQEVPKAADRHCGVNQCRCQSTLPRCKSVSAHKQNGGTFWLWPKRGSAWLIVFSGQFLKPTLVRCTQRFEQSLGGCLRVAALQGLVAIRLLDPLARQAARSMTALNPVGGSLRAER
jgi:hypothetical protein